MRSICLLALLIPDRLPSLIVLVTFWVPPLIAGCVAAWLMYQRSMQPMMVYAMLALFVLGYAALWYFYNVSRMPPYIPGATMDPASSPPEAVRALAIFTAVAILPGSAIAAVLALKLCRRLLSGTTATASA